MPNSRLAGLLALALALGTAAGAQVPAAARLTNIGIAAAVHGAVRASAPDQVGRVVASGQAVYLNDHVTTGPEGRLQILLLDETTFTLGPNSDMVLDEFVYDPKSGAGKVSARISAGAFRFVTGKVARKDPASMKVVLPVGTIGIRGTMVAGRAYQRDAEIVLVGPGPENNAQERRGGITVSNAGGSSDVNASGYGVRIVDGGRPSRGFRFNAAQLAVILDELEPRHTAGRGGPPDAPRASGDVLAHGGINSAAYQGLTAVSSSLDQTTTFASQQQQVGSNINNWNDLLAIQTGIAGYQGSGNYTCSGSGCTAILGGTSGTYNFGINVNFGNRTIGGDGASTISIGPENLTPNAISYAARSGPATYTYTSADNVSGNFGTIAGTTLTFLKANGQNAGALQLNMVYTLTGANSGTATGTATAPKGPVIVGG